MFIGHFAVAFAAKKAAPSVSLGTLFLATQLADLVWPTLVLLGIEIVEIRPGITAFTPLEFVHYPYSHSLLALTGWGFALAVVYGLVRRPPSAALLTLFALVISHWALDVLSHRADMPLTITGRERLGFDLWNSIPATLIVETLMFAGGVAVYYATTRPARSNRKDRVLDAGRLPLRRLPRVELRPSAAECRSGSLERAGDLATRGLGLLGRSASPAQGRGRRTFAAEQIFRSGEFLIRLPASKFSQ